MQKAISDDAGAYNDPIGFFNADFFDFHLRDPLPEWMTSQKGNV